MKYIKGFAIGLGVIVFILVVIFFGNEANKTAINDFKEAKKRCTILCESKNLSFKGAMLNNKPNNCGCVDENYEVTRYSI